MSEEIDWEQEGRHWMATVQVRMLVCAKPDYDEAVVRKIAEEFFNRIDLPGSEVQSVELLPQHRN